MKNDYILVVSIDGSVDSFYIIEASSFNEARQALSSYMKGRYAGLDYKIQGATLSQVAKYTIETIQTIVRKEE